MKRYQVSPSIESTEDIPKYIVIVNELGGNPVQAGEIHELKAANQPTIYKAWSFRRITQEFYHRDQALNYVLEAYDKRNGKAQKIGKDQIQLFQ